MYNNFSSKKTKKVISALLASALVVTSAPISAEAATTKVLGVNKTFTKTATKVSGLSSAEKKIVKVTVNKSKKKVTVKGIKPGKASFKIGSKSYTVKVGATAIKKKSFATSMTAGTNKKVTVTSSYGAKDTLAWSSSNKKVVKVKLASTTATSKKVATNRLYALAAGTATITVKSKNTGKSLKVKVTVKAATPATTPTTVPTATGSATTTPSVAPTATATGSATTTPSAAPTATVSGGATTAPSTVPTATGSATTAPTEAPTAAPTETPITASASAVSASAVSSKKIAITFDRALTADEIAGLKVNVTREKATQAIKFAVDGKTLYITRDSETAFAAATYNVVISGTVNATADVEVAASVAKSLDITSSVIVDGEKEAEVKVALLDQYGDEMALSDLSFVVTNKTQGKTAEAKISNGKVVIDTATTPDQFKTDDEVQITILHNTSGLSVTKTLKVVEATYVTDITLDATPVLPTGATRLTQNVKGVKIYYTAKDNYGDTVDLQGKTDEFKIVSTNQDVVKDTSISAKKDDAGKTYFEIASFATPGTTSLVALANKSGNTSKIDLTVLENAGEVYTAEFETTSVEVAKGSTAYVGVKFYDKYGDPVKPEDAASSIQAKASDDKVQVSFDSVATSDHYGKLAIDATEATEDTTVIVTATVKNVPTVLTVKVGKKAVPSNFTATAEETALIIGSGTKVKLNVKDQYGSDANNLTGYEIKVSTNSAINNAEVSADKKTIVVTGTAVGSHDMKIDLINTKDNNKIVDTKTVTLTVVENTASNLTYTTEAIPTLYKKGAVDNAYAKEVKVTAKTSAGTVVSIPADKILSVTSDNSAVQVEKNADGKYVVYGREGKTALTADVTANISVVVATDDGSTVVKTTATVSKDEKQYKELKFVKTEDGEDVEVTAYKGTYAGVALDTLYAVDQFGVKNKVASTGELKVDAISLSTFSTAFAKASDDKAEFDGSKLVITDAKGDTTLTAGTNGTLKATFVVGALTKTIDVTITSVGSTQTPSNTQTPTVTSNPAIGVITISGTGVSGTAITDKDTVSGTAILTDIDSNDVEKLEYEVTYANTETVVTAGSITVTNAELDENNTLTFSINTKNDVIKGKYTIKLKIAGATQTVEFIVEDAESTEA